MDFSHTHSKPHQYSKILTGIFVIGFGSLFLLDRLGYDIPNWMYSWKMFLIAGGIVTLVKHRFKHFLGYLMIGIGSVLLINDFAPDTIDSSLIFPTAVILFGAMIISKATNGFGLKKKESIQPIKSTIFDEENGIDSNDYLDSTTIFGGTNKTVVSKQFQGASITTLFSGTEINLTKADIQGPIVIDSTTAFGGLTLIVPSHWEVRSEITSAFGGIEDKRPVVDIDSTNSNKILTLKGGCYFGGVEIHSYA